MKRLLKFNEHFNSNDIDEVISDFAKYGFEVTVVNKISESHFKILVNGFTMMIKFHEDRFTCVFISEGLGLETPKLVHIIEKDVVFSTVKQVVNYFKMHDELMIFSSKKLVDTNRKTGILE